MTNYFLIKPMLFSNLKLHLTTTRSSTFSGFKLAVLGVTTLPATEKTRSDLDEAAGTGKTTLSLARGGNCVMLPPSQVVHGGQLVRQQLERLRFTICGLFFWTGGMATGCRDEYVVIIFQFFPNII